MKIFFLLSAVIAMFSIGGVDISSSSIPEIPTPDLSTLQVCRVSRVVDGDTLVVLSEKEEIKIRLIGIDTPETVHPTKPVEEYGKEASRFLANLMKGEKVYLSGEGYCLQKDKYGRSLAYVYRYPDGLFVNAEIIRQGYGHVYTQFPFKYMEQFRSLEQFARQNQKGLWEATPVKEKQSVKQIDSQEVFITRTGKSYHREGCSSLSRSKTPVQRTEAFEKGYKPCSVCKP